MQTELQSKFYVVLEGDKEIEQYMAEQIKLMAHYATLRTHFDEREAALIKNAVDYAKSDNPAGLPGHNLMLIISKLIDMLGLEPEEFSHAWRFRPLELKTYPFEDLTGEMMEEALEEGISEADDEGCPHCD